MWLTFNDNGNGNYVILSFSAHCSHVAKPISDKNNVKIEVLSKHIYHWCSHGVLGEFIWFTKNLWNEIRCL